jgi:hypothetical protein
LLLSFLTGLLLITGSEANACSCSPEADAPACQLISQSEVVFLGESLELVGDPRYMRGKLYRFRVERIYKGLDPGTREVMVNPGAFTSCETSYTPGVKYLMFAGATSRNPLRLAAWLCSGSRPTESNKADVEFLEQYVQGKTRTEVFGKVLQWVTDIGRPRDDESAPLQGAKVTLKSANHRYTVLSQFDGSFRFSRIPEGNYEISASLAPYIPEPSSYKVSVSKGACNEVFIQLMARSEIAGVLLGHDGRPVKKERIELLRRNRRGEWYSTYNMRADIDEQGRFRFRDIESGDYLLGHEIWRNQPSDWTAWPTLYYPGVSDRTKAQVITVAPRQKIDDLTITLLPPHKERKITIKVVWPDGRPPGKNLLQIFNQVGLVRNLEGSPARNVITFTGYQEREYEFTARYWIDNLGGDDPTPLDEKRIAKPDPIKLAPGKEPVEIVLTLRHEMRSKDER